MQYGRSEIESINVPIVLLGKQSIVVMIISFATYEINLQTVAEVALIISLFIKKIVITMISSQKLPLSVDIDELQWLLTTENPSTSRLIMVDNSLMKLVHSQISSRCVLSSPYDGFDLYDRAEIRTSTSAHSVLTHLSAFLAIQGRWTHLANPKMH